MKVLIFRLYGDRGHFKHYYTTSSPTTYGLIPPTAVMGVIGAILGLKNKNNEYISVLTEAGCKIGTGIVGKVSRSMMGMNLLFTKSFGGWFNSGEHTQAKYEYVNHPDYEIYVSMDDENLLYELAAMVESHKCAYTVSLGLSELIGDFKYVYYGNAQEQTNNEDTVLINSSVPVDLFPELKILPSDSAQLVVEKYVRNFDRHRVPQGYVRALFSQEAKLLNIRINKYYTAEGRNFVYLV